MSSEQTLPASDLRSAAQDYKRDAAHKHKWALGSVVSDNRSEDHPRPHRPSETHYNVNRRYVKGAVVTLETSGKSKLARKQDMLAAGEECASATTSDESSASADEDFDVGATAPHAAEVMYSFDAAKGPSHGSQILNVALAKAIEKYEDKQTDKLVRAEYEVLDSDGESLGPSPVKKGKGMGKEKFVVDEDDYEFV